MTTAPLPSYGIWDTNIDGKRIMGFTPEQFLSVWQARADLEAENKRLREALKDIARQPEGDEDSAQAVARAALKDTK